MGAAADQYAAIRSNQSLQLTAGRLENYKDEIRKKKGNETARCRHRWLSLVSLGHETRACIHRSLFRNPRVAKWPVGERRKTNGRCRLCSLRCQTRLSLLCAVASHAGKWCFSAAHSCRRDSLVG